MLEFVVPQRVSTQQTVKDNLQSFDWSVASGTSPLNRSRGYRVNWGKNWLLARSGECRVRQDLQMLVCGYLISTIRPKYIGPGRPAV